MDSLWRRLYQKISGQSSSTRRRSRPPAPALRILRLERRRVLSADFSLGASGLVLQGFDAAGGETLSISQLDTEYRFTLSNEAWETPSGALPNGIQIDGQTLAIDSSVVDQIVNGLTVVGNANSPLHITLGEADFSWLQGPLTFEGIHSLNQVANTQFTVGAASAMEVNAADAGVTIGSINIAGDLNITAFGPLLDGDGTEINVTGNATFISRALRPAADFDGDGTVTELDYGVWSANFGITVGATNEQGDANGDGAVDIVDYVVWRGTLGAVSEPGGITLADNPTDILNVGGIATFVAQDGASRFNIDVGSMGTTHFGSLAVIGADVQVAEDSSTELIGVDATSFTLQSAGSITDGPGTPIIVTGLAIFDAGANAITLGDNPADTTNFGQLQLTGGDVSVVEDSGMELTGVTAVTLYLKSSGPITDAPGATIGVTGLATFDAGGNSIVLGDDLADTTNFGQLHLTGGTISVTEDSGTELTGVSATSFNLVSNGPITDAAGTTINVTGLATLNAGGNPITLGDDVADTTNFGQLHLTGGAIAIMEDSGTELTGVTAASLQLTSDGPITDAPGSAISVTGLATLNAGANPITLGDSVGDTTNFGQLNLTGGVVAVAEDSGTELTGVSATAFTLTSAGQITDAAGTTVTVTGLATLNAGANPITLGDNAGDTTNFGQLHLTGTAVTVTEDSSTELTGVSATTLTLVSTGPITDAPNTTISVTGLATLNAGANPITLGDNAGDTTNFGQLHLTGGAVSIMEDSGTELTGVSASSLALTSSGPITDAPGATIFVTGPATLNAGANPITLGDNAGDTTNFGQLNLTGGVIAITEDSGTELTGVMATTLNLTSGGPITDAAGTTINVLGSATLNAGASFITLGDNVGDTTNFGQLHLIGGVVAVTEDSATVLTGITATTLNLTSAGSITDAPGTTIGVNGLATLNAGANPITLGDNVGDTTNFGQLQVTGTAVAITEDSGTDLTGVMATTFHLTSAGPITDALNATISVMGLAIFNAGANPITLGDNPGDTTNFGQLNLTGTAVTITEDSSTELTGVSANSLLLTSAGAITDAVGTSISVTTMGTFNAGGAITLADNAADNLSVGAASFSAPTFNIAIGPAGTANFGTLFLNGAAVTVQEDSSTDLTGITANSLLLTSAGAITDAPSTAISVATMATFNAGGAITLADNAADVLSVGGLATFSAPTFNITIGPAGMANFGSLNLSGAAITVQEDSSTELTGIIANSLSLTSAGAITDASGAAINVTTTATLNAGGAITLNDNAADSLSVGGLATFSAPMFNITIGPAGTANFGSLNLNGAAVTVQEDSATELTGITANSLVLTSAGAITDAADTTINVVNAATFNAGGDITLADNAADNLFVGGLATFSAPTSDIFLGPAGSANFGSLNLIGEVIDVQEDSATLLTGVMATSFELDSAGAIADSATAVIFVGGPASLLANGTITLADVNSASNSLIVVDLGSFQVSDGNNIDIGVLPASGLPAAANAQLGALQFTANALMGVGGQVRVALDGPIILSGSGGGSAAEDAFLTTTEDSAGGGVEMNRLAAGSLDVNSDGAITDAPESDVAVAGASIMRAKGPITLADQGSNNEFEVGAHARFISTQGNTIDLGVVPEADPTSLTRGTATDAKLNLGSVSFVSDEGDVTANLDNAVVLANMSLAGSAWLQSAGSLTDAFGADTTITQFAILRAADGSDIVLGDDSAPGDTRFRMDTPVPTLQVFDADRFLALKAEDVSIQVDSGFNLRTGPNDSAFPGTVFLQATGNISQVGHGGDIQPLEANRIAMLSAAAILFSQVRVNSQVTTDGTTPANLAIHGGAPLPVSVLPSGQFPVDMIPSSTITEFSPIGINPAGTEQGRPDGSGLNDLIGAQILEPAPIGDGYSIIMKVLGDAKFGIVQDATGTQADLVGVSVNTGGNVFLQTVADDGGGSGGMVPDPITSEVGNIVFTSRGAPTETVVQMSGGVFTAIAAAKLTIDTDQPGSESGAITTKLSSATGTVTSVGEFFTFDGNSNSTVLKDGPRFILDAPLDDQNAATTGLIFAPEFEQRLTLVAGSRGENNLVFEVVWADVFNPPTVPGSNPFPDVALVPESIEGLDPQPLIQSSIPALDFRAITVRHNFAESFIPANPNLPTLPTTIRVYNDPAINLFDQGGANNLNVTDNFVSPDVFAVVTGGYFEITSIELPVVYEAPQQVISVVVTTVPQDRVVVDEIRVTNVSEIDVIRYGRVGEDGEFIEEEGWPLTWEQGREGDFLNDIRESVNASTSLEGAYRIEAETTRGTQPLEEWTKGDAADEAQQNEADAASTDENQELNPQENGSAPVDDPAAMQMPSSGQVGVQVASYETTENGNLSMAGQLLIGASALVVNRWSRQRAEASRVGLRPDYSREARRRRARLRRAALETV